MSNDPFSSNSEQLNADDLIGGPIIITIERAEFVESDKKQPIRIFYGDESNRSYRPCLTMRKMLKGANGALLAAWKGVRLELYLDRTVEYGGKAVGGIRISRMSSIDKPYSEVLNAKSGQKKIVSINPLPNEEIAEYPAADFAANSPAWIAALESGKLTVAELAAKVAKKGKLTAEQIATLTKGSTR